MARNRPEGPSAIDKRSITAEQEERERTRAAVTRWRESHREQARRATRNWQKANPERVRAQKRRWYKKHREEIKAKNRLHYHRNRDRVRAEQSRARDRLRKYVIPAELETCREDPREAKKIKGPAVIVCLECGEMLESLSRHLMPEHQLTAGQYKAKWGYNRKTALFSANLKPKFSLMARNFRKYGRIRDRRKDREKLLEMLPAARRTKKNLEYRLDKRDKHMGKPRPELWNRTADGRVATDWKIAELHLQGLTAKTIARRVGLACAETVGARLRRMGFRSARACLYDRGVPITGHHLWDLYSDSNFSRRDLANRMAVTGAWLGNRMSPLRVERSLTVEKARLVLALRRNLIEERRKTSATPKGGRPRALLPSEQESLPQNYQVLRQELKTLRSWLREQRRPPQITEAWEWLCAQSHRAARTLLFWPQFLHWLRACSDTGFFVEGNWAPNEVTIEFLAAEYGVSEETVRRLVYRSTGERSGTDRIQDPLTVKLLADLRIIFGDQLTVPSAGLVDRLRALDASPWRQFGLTPLKLADCLRRLGVRGRNIRSADRVLKGYQRKDLDLLWLLISAAPAKGPM